MDEGPAGRVADLVRELAPRLSPSDRETVELMQRADEWQEAVDSLVSGLRARAVHVAPEQLSRLSDVCIALGLPRPQLALPREPTEGPLQPPTSR